MYEYYLLLRIYIKTLVCSSFDKQCKKILSQQKDTIFFKTHHKLTWDSYAQKRTLGIFFKKECKLSIFFQDGTLRNGDHLLAVGDVRLWGMGAEQVASILRQAGQESIRLVVARPIEPSVPQFAVSFCFF